MIKIIIYELTSQSLKNKISIKKINEYNTQMTNKIQFIQKYCTLYTKSS